MSRRRLPPNTSQPPNTPVTLKELNDKCVVTLERMWAKFAKMPDVAELLTQEDRTKREWHLIYMIAVLDTEMWMLRNCQKLTSEDAKMRQLEDDIAKAYARLRDHFGMDEKGLEHAHRMIEVIINSRG